MKLKSILYILIFAILIILIMGFLQLRGDDSADSTKVVPVLKAMERDFNKQAQSNPKLHWKFTNLGDVSADVMQRLKLPLGTEGKIINFDNYGGILWLNGDSCYMIVQCSDGYILEWWGYSDKHQWRYVRSARTSLAEYVPTVAPKNVAPEY